MKIFHLNNPVSGHTNGAKFFPRISKALAARGIECDFAQTEYVGHGTELVQKLDFDRYDAIAVSGGDGTLFEALNGYFANTSAKRIPIGVIPIGRGNAFARDLDLIPERWEEAITAIHGLKIRKVDVGRFTTGEKTFYFINILGFGFVTDIAATALRLRMLGDLSYLIGVFHRTIALKPYNLKMEYDGKTIERENIFVEISNSRYTGKDFLMAPEASISIR
jgi:diacylglycerol kinase (ATP)